MELSCFFEKAELTPVIIQDVDSREVLMLGYTNQEALRRTLESKTAWFWSRSRNQLWNKGESSGNFLHVVDMITDCDTYTLLYLCHPDGPTCHTGKRIQQGNGNGHIRAAHTHHKHYTNSQGKNCYQQCPSAGCKGLQQDTCQNQRSQHSHNSAVPGKTLGSCIQDPGQLTGGDQTAGSLCRMRT